ncbi:MAG TPA: PilN domain-containing protein [Gammaproteobacteria bacterium]
MPRINLLPWRAELRQRRKKEFFTALLATVLFGGLLVYASKLTVQGWISTQNKRNELLRTEIAELERQIKEIENLETQKARLIARMEIIDRLQRSRPEVVHLFDEIVNAVPEGVYLTQVTQSDSRIQIKGMAESSTRVSTFMRNIDNSEHLRDPGLDVVETVSSGPGRSSQFTIFARQVPMAEEEPAEAQTTARARR